MSSALLIRRAEQADMIGFLRLSRAIGNAQGVLGEDPGTDFQNYLIDMRNEKVAFLLALVGEGEIVGFSTVKFYKRLDPSGFDPISCTIGIAVHPNYRRRGIGTNLVERGLEEARKRGIKTAYTSTFSNNVAMQKFAERLGFEKYGKLEKNGLTYPRYMRKI